MSQDLWDLVSDGFVDLIDPTDDENNQANFADNVDDENKLFIALFCEKEQIDDVWFVDSGCSYHIQEQNSVC